MPSSWRQRRSGEAAAPESYTDAAAFWMRTCPWLHLKWTGSEELGTEGQDGQLLSRATLSYSRAWAYHLCHRLKDSRNLFCMSGKQLYNLGNPTNTGVVLLFLKRRRSGSNWRSQIKIRWCGTALSQTQGNSVLLLKQRLKKIVLGTIHSFSWFLYSKFLVASLLIALGGSWTTRHFFQNEMMQSQTLLRLKIFWHSFMQLNASCLFLLFHLLDLILWIVSSFASCSNSASSLLSVHTRLL